MGICDFRGTSDNAESGHVVLDAPSAAKTGNQLTLKNQEDENAVEEVKVSSNDPQGQKHISFSNPDMNSEDIVNDIYNNEDEAKSQIHNEKQEITSGRVIVEENNQFQIEAKQQDQANTSLDEIETSVQPVIVNKKRWENCKVEHPLLKKNLMGGMKNLLQAQIHAS